MDRPEHLRLFIAITAPEAVKDKLTAAQARLRSELPQGLARWTKREQFHLTLKFLGEIESCRLDRLIVAARAAARLFAPLRLRAEGIGFFPEGRFPRVVWAGITDESGHLSALQCALETAVQPFTPEPPEPHFAGHITLGRFQRLKPQEAERLADAAGRLAGQVFGAWTASEIDLMRSDLSPQGARHSPVASLALAPITGH
jgi:RNA 2',3'-cyclic 3'-phosphodiesterase